MRLNRDEYITAIRAMFGSDPQAIADANRKLFKACLDEGGGGKLAEPTATQADLALAEAGA